MNKYTKLQKKHQEMINDFPCFYAFSNEQLEDGLKKLNITRDNLLNVGYGGFIDKKNEAKYVKMWLLINTESKDAMKDEEYLYQAFRYELGNHEYSYTYEYEDTLACLGLKFKTLTEKQLSILEKAKSDYLEVMEA